MEETTNVAILPSPGMGHLIPLTELAKRLILQFNLSVTFIIPTDGSPMKIQRDFLQSLPKTRITSIFLPPVSLDDLPESTKIETRIALSLIRSLPALRQTLNELIESTRLSVLVVDVFGTLTIDLARELRISPYVFRLSNAMTLSALLHLPNLDQTFPGEFRDLPEPVELFPGCIPVFGRDFSDPVQDRNNEAYRWILQVSQKHQLAEGFMVNSFLDLEPAAFKALNEEGLCKSPVYPVGPLIRTGSPSDGGDLSNNESTQYCLKWLDEQPTESVLLVSFGSGGTLTYNQLTELATGLEMSGQKFIWVVKSPNEAAANASYFNAQTNKDPFDFLPKGFIDRTKELGLVVSSWAPQVQILGHGSTGGFLTHCGWNSTLESIVHGVPLIAWPLYAEQRLNAVMLAEDLKVALRVKVNKDGLVEREEVAKKAKELIEGEEGKILRKKVKDLKDAAAKVLGPEGSSTKSLSDAVQKWMNNI